MEIREDKRVKREENRVEDMVKKKVEVRED